MYPSAHVPSFHRDRFSIFSHSLGDHSEHKLPYKLTAAAYGGFPAVEISLIDLEDHATQKGCDMLEAAQEIGEVCRVLGLRVTCLQPLRDVVESRKPASDAADKAVQLFPVMDALDTQLLLVCSSSLPANQLDPSFHSAVSHLKAIGTAAANWKPHPKKIAFEALSWGTHINLWRQAWDVVQAVDMENVGICLDSFNTLAREWADPTVEGGIQADADEKIRKSMSELSELPGAKIFLLQIGDGARLKEPLERGTQEKPALMTWSRSSRLFPMEFERGGYLPVSEFIEAVVKTGYAGPWSLEVFNNSLRSPAGTTPITHAIRGFYGLSKLVKFVFANHQIKYQKHASMLLQADDPSFQFLTGIRPSYNHFKPSSTPAFHRTQLSSCSAISDSSSLEVSQESDPDHSDQSISNSPGKLYGSDIRSVHSPLQISSTLPLHLI